MTAFSDIPGSELYIFPGQSPSPTAAAVQDSAGQVPQAYAYEFSKVAPTPLSGGSIKVADASVFPIAQQIAMAEIIIEPGAMRELHVSDDVQQGSFKRLTMQLHSGTRPRTSGVTSCAYKLRLKVQY